MAKRERVLLVKLPEDAYRALEQRARAEGYNLVSDYVRAVIMRELGYEGYVSRIDRLEHRIEELEKKREGIDAEKLRKQVERTVMDLVNPFTAEVQRIKQQVAELVERIEGIEEKIKELSETQRPARPAPQRYEKRKSGIDRLREQGVLFESDLTRLRDRDRFFAYLEREGAVILHAEGERIALYPDFWEGFKEKLARIHTNIDDEVRKMLTPTEYRLFRVLKESGLIYYDSSTKTWRLIEEPG